MSKLAQRVLERGRATVISTLIVTLVVFVGGFYVFSSPSQAAGLTFVKATLTDPTPTSNSNWEIQKVTDAIVNEDDTITYDFDTLGTLDQLDLTGLREDATNSDFDLVLDTDGSPSSCSGTLTQQTLNTAAGASAWGVTINTSTDTITLTAPSTASSWVSSTQCIILRIGTNAVTEFTGTNQINNPAKVNGAGIADIYDVAIQFAGNSTNSGTALVAVIEAITVTVSVDESLAFVINGVASGSCTQGGSATAITTTTTTVPFGSSGLAAETFYKGCHDLIVSTNASSGYAISSQENRSLLAASNTIDDTICDGGACTEVVSAGTTNTWSSATNNGLGYTCDGASCNAAFTDGGAALGFSQFACTGADAVCDPGTGAESAQAFTSASTPVASSTSRVVYKLSFDSTQPAGDYSNTVTYIATPTF